ncbi:type II secretion system minor pseudopilin GspJ [Pseudoalteromonas fenneropenaei]|uniref:Type II secretion system protein J n=1 Tax=Pseudoalteromonas fenneropenaei TaxID=1737459 RepID=A0ABV7CQ77_9GAMM
MKARGFTLLEVMVALGILAVVVMATHQILESTLSAKEASDETLAELQALQTTFRFIDQDLSQMTERKVRNQSGDEAPSYLNHGRYAFESQYDGLGFVRDGWTNPIHLLPRSELQAVAYRVKDDKLERLYRIYVEMLDDAEPKVQVLLSDVEELKFEFMDDSKKWQEEWKINGLPRAVAVTLKQKDRAQIKRIFAVPGLGRERETQTGEERSDEQRQSEPNNDEQNNGERNGN